MKNIIVPGPLPDIGVTAASLPVLSTARTVAERALRQQWASARRELLVGEARQLPLLVLFLWRAACGVLDALRELDEIFDASDETKSTSEQQKQCHMERLKGTEITTLSTLGAERS